MTVVFQKVEKLELPQTKGNIKYFSTDGSWPHFGWIGQKNAFHYTSKPYKAEELTQNYNNVNCQVVAERIPSSDPLGKSIRNFITDSYPKYLVDVDKYIPSEKSLLLMNDICNHEAFLITFAFIIRGLAHISVSPDFVTMETYIYDLEIWLDNINNNDPSLKNKLGETIITLLMDLEKLQTPYERQVYIKDILNDIHLESYQYNDRTNDFHLVWKFNSVTYLKN